jgi:proline dehydrogenase
MISFENTEIAFSSKSNNDLLRSYWLFRLIASSKLVKLSKILLDIALKIRFPINSIVKKTIFKQFCGGENISDCKQTIDSLEDSKIGAILDYSTEGKTLDIHFDKAMSEIISTISFAKSSTNVPFCVFKLSGISSVPILYEASQSILSKKTPTSNFNSTKNRVFAICESAFKAQIPIFIDAEESWIQPAIDHLANEMMAKFNKEKTIVYNTYQLYRKDRLEYLKESILVAKLNGYKLGAKLVRGAYMEKERKRALEFNYVSPIHETKLETDKDYNSALNLCIENIDFLAFCAGTHNENSSLLLYKLMKSNQILLNDKRIYFSQLLGMSDHISFNLSSEGCNVAKYVPYGPINEVLPYLIRRAEENTSVKGQTNRELSLIQKERLRRKNIGVIQH